MKKHALFALSVFMHMALCNSSFAEDSLIIMTPYVTKLEKGYFLSLTAKESRHVICSEGLSANLEKNELQLLCTNGTMTTYDPSDNNARPITTYNREVTYIFHRNSKIIIDGRIFPFEKISSYLNNPEKFNREEALLQQELSKQTAVTANNIDCIHEAMAGDTFDSIAAMYGLNIDDLKNANRKIKEMKPGTEVNIPGNVKNNPTAK